MKQSWQERIAPLAEVTIRPLKEKKPRDRSKEKSPPKKPTLEKQIRRRVARFKTIGVTISVEDFHALWAEQAGKCAICEDLLSPNAHIDHDHETGIVRGLLCPACNGGIGLLKDSAKVLQQAAKYLLQHLALVERVKNFR